MNAHIRRTQNVSEARFLLSGAALNFVCCQGEHVIETPTDSRESCQDRCTCDLVLYSGAVVGLEAPCAGEDLHHFRRGWLEEVVTKPCHLTREEESSAMKTGLVLRS